MNYFLSLCYNNAYKMKSKHIKGSDCFMKSIPNNVNKIINEFVSGVNEILGNRLKKIILYGSYARRRFYKKF